MDRQEAVNREEAVRTISRISGGSVSYAEDLYDSFFPKPVVPQYVADWYEEIKGEFYLNLHYLAWDMFESLDEDACVPKKTLNDDITRWYRKNENAIKIIVNMHQFGYEVEKEKRYTVRFKGLCDKNIYLTANLFRNFWKIKEGIDGCEGTVHTRKELESKGFGWVFDCEGVEVKEVE